MGQKTIQGELNVTGSVKESNTPILSNLAAAYDSTATYSIGAYCIHDGKLYKCTSDISVAEEWNSAHWSESKTSVDIAALKAAVQGLEDEGVKEYSIETSLPDVDPELITRLIEEDYYTVIYDSTDRRYILVDNGGSDYLTFINGSYSDSLGAVIYLETFERNGDGYWEWIYSNSINIHDFYKLKHPGSASAGKVLTAGNDGYSAWATPAAGTKLYLHTISITYQGTGGTNTRNIYLITNGNNQFGYVSSGGPGRYVSSNSSVILEASAGYKIMQYGTNAFIGIYELNYVSSAYTELTFTFNSDTVTEL